MKKVLLLSMPMGALERPALGLSLLKARLNEKGFACDVRYMTFAFAEFIGQEDYQWMCYELPYTAFAGDWSFTDALYGERPGRGASLRRNDSARGRGGFRIPISVGSYRSDQWYRTFLTTVWMPFPGRITPSLASPQPSNRISRPSRWLNESSRPIPKSPIVFGGANWEAEMGHELHRQFPVRGLRLFGRG